MKINHKKLNIAAVIVIVLMVSLFVVFCKNISKKCENVISEDDIQSEAMKYDLRGAKSELVDTDATKLSELKYKDIYNIDVKQYDKVETGGVIDFVHFVVEDKLSIRKNEVDSFGFKYNDLITKGVIVRNVPIGMRTNADVVTVDVWGKQNEKQRYILTFEYICKGGGCGWIYRPVEDSEMEDIIVELLTEQYLETKNNKSDKEVVSSTELPELKYRKGLKINVFQYKDNQKVEWKLLAFSSNRAVKSKEDFKVDTLDTVVYKKSGYYIGGYILREIGTSTPSDVIGDDIFITVCENQNGWCDISKSFVISVMMDCEDECENGVEYKAISDDDIREIIDLLIKRECQKK